MSIKRKEYNMQVYNEYIPQLAPGYYFIPLGGTNMIGMNFNVFGIVDKNLNESWIICDIGISILQQYGIKLEMASPYALAHKKIDGIIITHAHDDHIAGLVYILDLFKNAKTLFDRTNKIDVYMTSFAADVINFKLEKYTSFELKKRSESSNAQYDFDKNFVIKTMECNKAVVMGAFRVTLLNITHSTLESNMVKIEFSPNNGETFDYTLLHTADWKEDCSPVLGEPANLALIKQNCNHIDMVLCDSTNADRPGTTPSESSVEPYLHRLLTKYTNSERIIVSFFATNVARVKTVLKLARETNRQIVLYGTSMIGIFNIAAKHNYISRVEYESVMQATDLTNPAFKGKRFLIVCTGSQGEDSSVLCRIAEDKFRYMKIIDTPNKQNLNNNPVAIFASNVIPGNEDRVADLKNALLQRGVIVVDTKNDGVFMDNTLKNDEYLSATKAGFLHVSGHPCRDDLEHFIKIMKPHAFIPVHGDKMHTVANRDLANKVAPHMHSLVVSDGNIIMLNAKKDAYGKWKPEILSDKKIVPRKIYIDGYSFVDDCAAHLRPRITASQHGVVVIIIQGFSNVMRVMNIGCVPIDTNRELHQLVCKIISSDKYKIQHKEEIESAIPTATDSNRNSRTDRPSSIKSAITREIMSRFGKEPYIELYYI